MPKIIHERSKCVRCGACVSVCPEMFEMSPKDGRAILKNSEEKDGAYELKTEKIDCIKEADDICPVKIIGIED